MGISSLGVGSGILTQDVLDQLREVDEAQRITPITLDLANENDKKNSLEVLDASMTNLKDSINEIQTATLWDERNASVSSGSSVEVSAVSNTDVQDFSLNVTALATKQIEQSGSFAAKDTVVASAGTFTLNVGGDTSDPITLDGTETLDDIKKLINEQAGDSVNATVVQISTGDFRLFLSSVETGANKDISFGGTGLPTELTADLDTFVVGQDENGDDISSTGTNASFTYNGQAITRESNNIDDLITGLTMTLKETGVSEVSIAQDRTSILEKFDSFVEKFNSSIKYLSEVTTVSAESDERGIFSNDSTVKSMKRAISDMIESVGGSVGSLLDYGFDIDQDGKMTLDKTVLTDAMDENPRNVQAFFSGGDYTNDDDSVTTLTGAFVSMSTIVESYTKTNQTLDQLKESLTQNISSLEDRKESATERLDSRYAILKKQYAAYDALINKFNAESDIFTQLANADY